jgi:hypothetical protein
MFGSAPRSTSLHHVLVPSNRGNVQGSSRPLASARVDQIRMSVEDRHRA